MPGISATQFEHLHFKCADFLSLFPSWVGFGGVVCIEMERANSRMRPLIEAKLFFLGAFCADLTPNTMLETGSA